MSEGKRRGRKYNYTLMLFADSREGNVRQLRIDPVVVETVAALLVVALAALTVVCGKRGEALSSLRKTSTDQAQQIEVLERENGELRIKQKEFEQKIVVLSNTINRKVEEEEAKAAKEARACMPIGFPMTVSASVEQTGEEEPMVKLTASASGNIVAAGDGVVSSVTTDSGYLHCIRIDHGNGYTSIYRNDGEVMVREGDEVVRGSVLYVIGEDNTQLGYQIVYDGKCVEPMELLNIDG
ncbi:MAG: M23 family metallopeptidase [Ruminococcus flavefaciens]|nr:M23 family metallopeptidase [Ruminococcus flavefaciens]